MTERRRTLLDLFILMVDVIRKEPIPAEFSFIARLRFDKNTLMRVPLDPGDIIGHGCWETVKRILTPVFSLWVGSFCGVAGIYLAFAAELAWSGHWGDVGEVLTDLVWAVIWAPMALLLSVWSLLLVPMMGLVFYCFLRSERDTTWLWLGCVASTGLVIMTSEWTKELGFLATFVAWGIFTLLLVSITALCLFYKGMQRNAQARHLIEITAENEQRRSALEHRYGTKSFGQQGEHRD